MTLNDEHMKELGITDKDLTAATAASVRLVTGQELTAFDNEDIAKVMHKITGARLKNKQEEVTDAVPPVDVQRGTAKMMVDRS